MGIGADLKASVDAVRDELGSACTLNGTTALGKCGLEELTPTKIRVMLGEDYADETELPWMSIEAPAGSGIKENDKITVDVTGYDWVVRRVMRPTCGDVIMAERCLCVGELK